MPLSIPGIAMNGPCPAPFLPEAAYPPHGGYVRGRACAAYPNFGVEEKCCLPCPYVDYLYPDEFQNWIDITSWLNAGGMVLCLFHILSYAVLPPERTRRNSLNVCLLCAIILLQLGFVMPLAAKPNPCRDGITHNDITTSMSCAWASGFLVFGGMAIILWILARTIAMHLQIVWDITIGPLFTWLSHLSTWSVATVLTAATLIHAGSSFNYGSFCRPNSDRALGPFWAPLTTFACMSLLVQLATFAYCLQVYLRHALIGSSSPTPSGSKSRSRTPTVSSLNPAIARRAHARVVYRRVVSVLQLQWRGIAIALLATFDVIFFCIFFVVLDEKAMQALRQPQILSEWTICMVLKKDKNQCLNLRGPLAINQGLIIAVFIIFSLIGFEAFALLLRFDVFCAWADFFRGLWRRMRPRKLSVTLDDGPPRGYDYDMKLLKSSAVVTSDPVQNPRNSFGTSRGPIFTKDPAARGFYDDVDNFPLPRSDHVDLERANPEYPPYRSPTVSTTNSRYDAARRHATPRTSLANPLAQHSINPSTSSSGWTDTFDDKAIGEPGPALDEEQVRRNFSRP